MEESTTTVSLDYDCVGHRELMRYVVEVEGRPQDANARNFVERAIASLMQRVADDRLTKVCDKCGLVLGECRCPTQGYTVSTGSSEWRYWYQPRANIKHWKFVKAELMALQEDDLRVMDHKQRPRIWGFIEWLRQQDRSTV